MSALGFHFKHGGIHFPELGLWLDPHEPCLGPEKVFVSHAHSDHVAAHREVILSEPTSRLMQARMPGERLEHVLPFGAERPFEGATSPYSLTLVPAGHIFGSAMSLIRTGDGALLYTGDFKLRKGLSSEPCEPRHADILVMESTFGRPQYRFPPTAEVLQGVLHFCREALDNDETPVLLGYSLGKSQELLCGLAEAGLPIMLHGTVWRLTRIYEQFGQCFPKYEKYEAGAAKGKVLLCPPNVVSSAMLRNLGKTRTAILTGWAVDPNCRFRYRCDAAFPLSDHADFPDLVEFVKRVSPRIVYTLHGFAADFAQTLRDLGYDARSLSQSEQFTLSLGVNADSRSFKSRKQRMEIFVPPSNGGPRHPFAEFARTCRLICEDSRKLEKTRFLADYLKTLAGPAIALAATWFSGRPFPPAQNKVMQLGWAVLRDSLCNVAGVDETSFHQVYLKHSDLGETAAELLSSRSGLPGVTLEQVAHMFDQLHAARGPTAKAPILAHGLRQATPQEAKYLVKIITGDLRIGLKEGLVEEAVALAFAVDPQEVRGANLLVGDIGETARLASLGQLSQASLVPFRPVKFMLASPEETAAGIIERVRQRQDAHRPGHDGPAPGAGAAGVRVWLEDKYDGIRCQLHKADNQVALYSRDLKDISRTFPELAHAALSISEDVILDGEMIAMREDQVLPFSELQKRLGRKERDLFMKEEVPIRYLAFDILWENGRSLLEDPLHERRARLESLQLPVSFGLARITEAASAQDIESAFTAARTRGNEGLMIKDPESAYSPGRRGLAWLKLKKALATLDCVVIGAEYGHGKRSKVLSDYTFAVRDERTGRLETIGKAYTGLTDAEIEDLTSRFLRSAVRHHGRYFEVPPEVVLEIAFDRLQPSQRHSSGLAMRFPRIVRIRTDKSPLDIDTLQTAQHIAERNM